MESGIWISLGLVENARRMRGEKYTKQSLGRGNKADVVSLCVTSVSLSFLVSY